MNYHTANSSFEDAVKLLQKNLQYLANQGKVSSKFIALQNSIIANLITYQQTVEAIIEDLEMEVMQLSRGKLNHIEQLKDLQLRLEAVCIIHGVFDFSKWLNLGTDLLLAETDEMLKSKKMVLPTVLK